MPSESSTRAGRVPTFGEVGIGKFGKSTLGTFGNLIDLAPSSLRDTFGVAPYERDRKYYRVIGED